jgi:hypothetical protein
VGNRSLVFGCAIFALSLTISPGSPGQSTVPVAGGSQRPVPLSSPTIPKGNQGEYSNLPPDGTNGEDMDAVRRQRLAQYLAMERQKKNMEDSEKLVVLARELSAEYEKPAPSEVNSSQLDKIKEIEKLAKRVKQRLAVK